MKTALKIVMWIVLILLVAYIVLYVSAVISGNFGTHFINAPVEMVRYILSQS